MRGSGNGMKAAINSTFMKKLPEGPCDVYDTKLPGFVLRIQKSGHASYRVIYARGKSLTIGKATDLKPAEAREQAHKVLGEAAKGEDPQQQRKRQKAATLKSYIGTVYEPWLETNRKDGKAIAARLKTQFVTTMGSKKLHEVTPWLIEKWKSKRTKDGIKTATLNRDLNSLKAAFNRAVEWGYLDENPLAQVKPSKVDGSVTVRYLDSAEYERLCVALDQRQDEIRQERLNANEWRRIRGYPLMPDLSAVDYVDHLKSIVLLALNTGMRRGELFNLQWSDVDLLRKELTVKGDGSKSGQTRHIPLAPEALRVLKGWKPATEKPSDLVFPSKNGTRMDNINKAWRSLMIRAGIANFRFHDLRHTFASWLVQGGTDLYTVRDLLGHHSITMTERYAHLAPEHKAAAVASLAPPKMAKEGQAV
jgi:integrase